MGDIVLVHGTTQSSRGFLALVAELSARGHNVTCPDLPTSSLESSQAYVDFIAAQIPATAAAPIVAAHSGAGLLLPALAQRVRAARQVWLAALVPDYDGERSFADEIATDPSQVVHDEWVGVDPSTDPVLATYFLFHDAPLPVLRNALESVKTFDLGVIYREVSIHDPRAIASTYLVPTADRTVRPDWMLRVARSRLGIEPVTLNAGHNCYAAFPARVADVIEAG
jgi:hypothetical protein